MSKKVPSHLARELLRHVNKKKKATTTTITTTKKSNESFFESNRTLIGVLGFLSCSCSLPFVIMAWVGPLNNKEEALTSGQIRRGAFNNSGSRDVGRDPKWDFTKGLYKKDKEYWSLFEKDDPDKEELGDKYLNSASRRR
mmetsp:Transcript_29231/g.32346  ORF Transcript_29231/g.32346 Transcript_29231/m.32346 type:complete len:140 (+) Transcript_29231:110-529(+)